MERGAFRLVAITDNLRDGTSGLLRRTASAVRGGATMIQLRLADEGSRTLVEIARAFAAELSVPVVVHGRLDVALASGAAGVHLGVHDVSVADARRISGAGFVIGRSAGTAEDLAHAEGADYITLGPAFPADQRRRGVVLGLTEFERLARATNTPIIAVGGISPATAAEALRAGACGVALISGILGSPDPERAAHEVRFAIEN